MSTVVFADQTQERSGIPFVAQRLSEPQRETLAIEMLARRQPVSQLAREQQVSRKFLYRQEEIARGALNEAFQGAEAHTDRVLFYLPVSKSWIRQLVLALVLLCHASFRGVTELMRDLFDSPLSIASVHNIVTEAVPFARRLNAGEDRALLPRIRVGAHDEIYQAHAPVLVGCEVESAYCYLLSEEERADATSWGVHLLELQEAGLAPDHTIGDLGTALRAGQAEAWGEEVGCWGDCFHLLRDITNLSGFLDHRAYRAIGKREKAERALEKAVSRGEGQHLSGPVSHARKQERQAIALAEDVAILTEWLRGDVFAVVGPTLSEREALYGWILAELASRKALVPHRIGPLVSRLKEHQEEFLAFASDLDARLEALAIEYRVQRSAVRALFEAQRYPAESGAHYSAEALCYPSLGGLFHPLHEEIRLLIASVCRASSIVENLNSRLRCYFFLRKQLGPGYLDLLRFFLNHHRLLRSVRTERRGRSPAETLGREPQPHWLELLGFRLFQRT